MRPDVIVTIHDGERRVAAVVLECKLSAVPGYVLEGYHEAVLYRMEYAPHLPIWPKAILVASECVTGSVRETDDVVASSWDDWPPAVVAASIAAAACATHPSARSR